MLIIMLIIRIFPYFLKARFVYIIFVPGGGFSWWSRYKQEKIFESLTKTQRKNLIKITMEMKGNFKIFFRSEKHFDEFIIIKCKPKKSSLVDYFSDHWNKSRKLFRDRSEWLLSVTSCQWKEELLKKVYR